ncbi:MAG: IS256 family transposase [Candidatus Zophobacter franzmannii]|nr:IS256 family transposase [Candidatus Zophobacter franzmannii]
MKSGTKNDKIDVFVKGLLQDNDYNASSVSKEVLRRIYQICLENEMTEHIGYEHNSFGEKPSGNRRNGSTLKMLKTELGELKIDTPRDRDGSFSPVIIAKRQRTLSSVTEAITLLYGQNMSQRAISKFVHKAYGIEISQATISSIISGISDELTAWRNRQLDEVYPIVFIDAMVCKVKESYPDAPKRSNGRIVKKALYTITGLTMEGRRESLGLWVHDVEQATTWGHIFRDLKMRGVKDIMIICSDGLKGLKKVIDDHFPFANQQRCIVHLVRNSIKYVSYKHYKEVCKDLKSIYEAKDESQALFNLKLLEEKWDTKCPGIAEVWRGSWNEISPMFSYIKELRKIIYTNNSAESYNKEIRKVVKTKGCLPNIDALERLAFLRTKELEENRWVNTYPNWRIIRNELKLYFGDRLSNYEI